MAIKDLDSLLEKYKSGEIADANAFESELKKALAIDWVPKNTFNELSEKHKLAERQSGELTKQLEDLKTKASLSDEYKSQIEKLTETQKAEKEGFEKQLADLRAGYALDGALAKAKAKNVKAVKSLLDLTKLSYEGETVKGLDEQLEALRKSDAYLFDAVEEEPDVAPSPKPYFGNNMGAGNTNNGPNRTRLEGDMRHAAGLS